jgi:hypothetical protein
MKLFVTIYDDARLLTHLLRHYRPAGIDRFYIAAPPEFVPEVKRCSPQYDITLAEGLDVAESMGGGTAAVSEMRRRFQCPDEWVVIVDLDEFVEFKPGIPEILQAAENEGANVVRGIMYDRFSSDGTLPAIAPDSNLPELFPVKSRFTRDVMDGADWKGVLVKGRVTPLPRAGHHHFDGEKVCSLELEIAHYKWNDRAMERVRTAYAALLRAGVDWAEEYKRVIDYYDENGRFRWQDFGGVLSR